MKQALLSIAVLLLFPVAGYGVGILLSIPFPVPKVAGAPFLRTVLTNLAVFPIGGQFLLPVLTPAPLLACWLAADYLARLILRWLEGFLAVPAAALVHTGRCRTVSGRVI
jgi:hypothetical protein